LPYMLYLRWVVPLVGSLLLGNHENYRMLSRYTEAFQNCQALTEAFKQSGFDVTYHSFFFDSCTAVIGKQE
jgi:ubiquinone/menaquinone biosynthesis C-methylase UbiE